MQGPPAEEAVRVRGEAPAGRLQERLLQGRRRDGLRVQGEVQDNGNCKNRQRPRGAALNVVHVFKRHEEPHVLKNTRMCL